jgi:hypothetical protein
LPDYERHGTTLLSAALGVTRARLLGNAVGGIVARSFRQFLDTIDESVRGRFDVHLIFDN